MIPVYIKKFYSSRYFWGHLTLADLRAKYQRTALRFAVVNHSAIGNDLTLCLCSYKYF